MNNRQFKHYNKKLKNQNQLNEKMEKVQHINNEVDVFHSDLLNVKLTWQNYINGGEIFSNNYKAGLDKMVVYDFLLEKGRPTLKLYLLAPGVLHLNQVHRSETIKVPLSRKGIVKLDNFLEKRSYGSITAALTYLTMSLFGDEYRNTHRYEYLRTSDHKEVIEYNQWWKDVKHETELADSIQRAAKRNYYTSTAIEREEDYEKVHILR